MGEPDDPLIPDFALARYLPQGVLDTSFGELVDPEFPELGRTGKVLVNFGTTEDPAALTFDEASGVILLPNGNIVLVGSTRTELEGENDFAMAILSSTGELLSTHTTDFGGDDFARQLTLMDVGGQPMMVVVGTTSIADSVTDADFAVARYTLAGELDTGFGVEGKTTIDFFEGKDDAVDVLISGQKIIVVGHIKDSSRVEPQLFGGPLDFGVAQLTEAGELDNTFGALKYPEIPDNFERTGMVSTDLASTIYPEQVDFYSTDESWAGALQDGKIVVAGRYGAKGVSDFALVRYTATGELDETFGNHGAVHTDILGGPDSAYDVTVTSGNQIVLAGRATLNAKFSWAMALYNGDGELTESFAAEYFAGEEGGPDQANVVAEDAQGGLVVAGWVSMPGTMVDFGVARYTLSGGPMLHTEVIDPVASDLLLTTLGEEATSHRGRSTRGEISAEVLDEMLLEAEAHRPGWAGWHGAPGQRPHAGEAFEELLLEMDEEPILAGKAPWGGWNGAPGKRGRA